MGETIHFLYLMLLMSLYCIVFFAYCRCEPLLAQRIVLGELEKLGVFLSPNFKQLRMFELAERDDIYQSAIQMAASLPPPRPQQPTVMTQAGQHCFFVLVYCLNNTVEIICPPINLCIHPFIHYHSARTRGRDGGDRRTSCGCCGTTRSRRYSSIIITYFCMICLTLYVFQCYMRGGK